MGRSPFAVGERSALLAKGGGPLEIRRIVDRLGRVTQGQLAQLTVEPAALDRDRPAVRAHRGDDRRDRGVIEPDARELGEDGGFPGLVTQPSVGAPRFAGIGVELPMTAIGEGAIAPDLPPTHTFEEPAEQVDPAAVAWSPTPGLRAPNVLDPYP
jgi:hypothetical protein